MVENMVDMVENMEVAAAFDPRTRYLTLREIMQNSPSLIKDGIRWPREESLRTACGCFIRDLGYQFRQSVTYFSALLCCLLATHIANACFHHLKLICHYS